MGKTYSNSFYMHTENEDRKDSWKKVTAKVLGLSKKTTKPQTNKTPEKNPQLYLLISNFKLCPHFEL